MAISFPIRPLKLQSRSKTISGYPYPVQCSALWVVRKPGTEAVKHDGTGKGADIGYYTISVVFLTTFHKR